MQYNDGTIPLRAGESTYEALAGVTQALFLSTLTHVGKRNCGRTGISKGNARVILSRALKTLSGLIPESILDGIDLSSGPKKRIPF